MWGKVILGGIHLIGQIINYDERREFQNRGTEHINASIHVIDDLRLDEIDETKVDKVVSFIDKYISCSIRNKNGHLKLISPVKEVQTHHHANTS